jgi:glycosyltransferase involved in cell wall biosynthesis
VEWIEQGVDTGYIQDLPQDEMRRQFGIPLDKPVAVAVNDGDMARVIRLLSLAVRKNCDLLGIIVGKVGSSARQEAQRLGIHDRIHWTGWVSDEDYPRYLAAADFCVIALDDVLMNYARFPAKVLDFLAAARPVVAHNVGQVGALILNSDLGCAVGPSDKEFVAAIQHLASDRDRCRQVGLRGRQLMLNQWRWELRGPQISALLANGAR